MDNYIFIHVHAKPTRSSQQLSFKVKDEGKKRRNFLFGKYTFGDDSEFPSTFTYPSQDDGPEQYQPNERVFAIYKASAGRMLNVTVDSIDIEACCDWIEMTWLSPTNPPRLQYSR